LTALSFLENKFSSNRFLKNLNLVSSGSINVIETQTNNN